MTRGTGVTRHKAIKGGLTQHDERAIENTAYTGRQAVASTSYEYKLQEVKVKVPAKIWGRRVPDSNLRNVASGAFDESASPGTGAFSLALTRSPRLTSRLRMKGLAEGSHC
jgi:hypothetical protein